MTVVEIIVGVILIIMSIFLIAAVLLQSSKNGQLSGAIAGGSEMMFGKNKGKTIDKKLNKLTIVVGIIFAIVVLALYVIQPGKAKIDYGDADKDIGDIDPDDIKVTETEDEE